MAPAALLAPGRPATLRDVLRALAALAVLAGHDYFSGGACFRSRPSASPMSC